MENEFFLNAGIAPLLHFESSNPMPNWQQQQQQQQQAMELNCSSERSPDHCFDNPSWEKSTDKQSMQFDSALSSMVSSPVASNSNISNDSFVIRELIGKLGNIGNNNSPSEISLSAAHHYNNNNSSSSSSTNTSCYSTPLNSPPKMNHLGRKPLSLNSSIAEFAADPGFAERAARFSCFGSRSFNGRTTQLALNNNTEYNRNNNNHHNNNNSHPGGSNSISPLTGDGKLSRVSSSPALKAVGSQLNSNSQEESTVSEQNPNGEKALKPSNHEMNSRKRKAASKGKAKESALPSPSPSTKMVEVNENLNAKKSKTAAEGEGNENMEAKTEDETKTSPKPPEPPKDYIHVRARRGQATDSHSLAERVRREKISERMKLLQDLVPGCNKVTGKALMLDEIINYVQSLQRQVEFLSMKLASVNTRLDTNIDTLMSKDVFQPNCTSMAHPIFPIDSSAQAVYGHQHPQNQALHNASISNGPMAHCSMDPLDSSLCQNLGMQIQLPHLHGFSDIVTQYPAFGEDDLQAIVQMGFGQNPNRDTSLQPQTLHGPNQVSHMKVEL